MAFVGSQRALLHVLAASAIATFAGSGLVWWTPAFLSRSYGLTTGQAGTAVGLMNGVGGAGAIVISILVMVRLSRAAAKWQCYYLAVLTLLVTIAAALAHMTSDKGTAMAMLWIFIPLSNVYVGPSLALIQNLVPPRMRGLTVAILLFWANIANLALAPQLIGMGSDFLASRISDPRQSLRIALAVSALTGLWAAYHYWRASLTLRDDIARATGAGA